MVSRRLLSPYLPAAAVVAVAFIAVPAYAQVGVGTTTPNAKAALDIQAADKGLLIPRLDSAQRAAIAAPPDGLMVFQRNGRVGLWYAFGGTWFYIPDKLKSGDNLGNHTATQNLALNTANDLLLRDAADANHGLGWYGGGKLWNGMSVDGPVLYGFTAGALGTNTGGTRATALYWNNAGNVGLGTPAPNTRLSISPTATEPKITLWDGGNAASHYGFGISGGQINYHVNDPGASHVFYAGGKNGDGTELMRVRGDGRVGIGINAPQASLHVVGDARITALAGTGASRLVTADANGTLQPQSPLYGPGANAPTAPIAIGTVPTGATPRAVVVNPAGTRAYVFNGGASSGALQAFDISNPNATPVAVGAAVATGATPSSAAVHPAGNRIYVVNSGSFTLQAFDVSNPNAAPVAVGAAVSTGGATPRDIAVNPAGTRAYVVAGSSGLLQVYDITNPSAAPSAVGTGAATGAVPGGVAINPAGTRAYVVNLNSRTLQAYDISNPNATPVAVGAPVATVSAPVSIRVNPAGTRAYVIVGNNLQAFDISNPSVAPVAVGSPVATGASPISLAVNATGTRAYVVHSNTSELRTYDISNPNVAPVLIGSPVATNGSSFGVALNPAGSRAYVVNLFTNTLQAFTLPTPWLLTQGADGTFGSFDPATLADNLGNHTATQNLTMSDRDVWLRSDANHGLGWYGTGKLWNGAAVDGPALYGFGGGALGTNQNGTQTTALSWNNAGNVGIGTTTLNSTLNVVGSVSVAYATATSATFTLTGAHYTVRRFGGCNTITLPQPNTCTGRIYVLINSNGTGSNVNLTVTTSGGIYDDVTNTTITALAPNNRLTVQSDGTNWLVIGR